MAAVENDQPTNDKLNDSNYSAENASINSEGDAEDIIERLHDVTALTIPDRDIPSSIEDSDSTRSTEAAETGSVGAVSSTPSDTKNGTSEDGESSQHEDGVSNGVPESNSDATSTTSSDHKGENRTMNDDENRTSTKENTKKKGTNPVKGLLRKFTKSTNKSSSSRSKGSSAKDKLKPDPDLSEVTIDKLPQCFIVKYLGKRECDGLWGIKHVRKPVDEMVKKVTKQLETGDKPVELPLMYLVVSPKGLELREHKNNRVKDDSMPQAGTFPIDFISYGVQDLKFWRVFTFIVVQELSARSKKMDCHAFICDSSLSARKVAVSLAFAFRVNMRKLQQEGKEHRFQVDLRPPDELANKYAAQEGEPEAAEC
ncbi:uncharacterized protein LOC135473842 [Liolophura sinensis]|uniref:uncharacterized protein LOC135473842 n=1 Tax=Liolophura sinensis TaxID=3198878 RepID=UPI003158B3CB